MIDSVCVQLSETTESSVRVTLAASGNVDLTGKWELYGPRCEYGRTLASTFHGRLSKEGNVEFLVTEPCYWSSELPFLYDLFFDSGKKPSVRMTLGLRRLSIHRQSLYRASRRIVLRGMAAESPMASKLEEARRAEAALLLRNPSEDECALADRLGVDILADLRYGNADIEYVSMLTNHPSVAMIIVDGNQLLPCEIERLAPEALLGLAVYSDGGTASDGQGIPKWCRIIVADLNSQARPPAWMAACGRPVIAIRRGATYADFQRARAGCDRLQAELAPEFDLAGYFVGASAE